jgi:hypothetical protein
MFLDHFVLVVLLQAPRAVNSTELVLDCIDIGRYNECYPSIWTASSKGSSWKGRLALAFPHRSKFGEQRQT